MRLATAVFLTLAVTACGRPYQPETVEAARKGSVSDLYQYDEGVRALKLVRAAGDASDYLPCVMNRAEEALPRSATADLAVVEGEHYCQAKLPMFVSEVRRQAEAWNFDPNFPAEEMNPATSPNLHGLFVKAFNEARTDEQPVVAASNPASQQVQGTPTLVAEKRKGQSLAELDGVISGMSLARAKQKLGDAHADRCIFSDEVVDCLVRLTIGDGYETYTTFYFVADQAKFAIVNYLPPGANEVWVSRDECRPTAQKAYQALLSRYGDADPYPAGQQYVLDGRFFPHREDRPNGFQVSTRVDRFMFPNGGAIHYEYLTAVDDSRCVVRVIYYFAD